MEDLDSLLASGNIPDLFDVDELDRLEDKFVFNNLFLKNLKYYSILMEIKTDAFVNGYSDERSELYKFLIQVKLRHNSLF